jgi:glycerophosphoryl diester phosphodiesterase
MGEPLIIGHRGACGLRPEHTLPSYELAIALGADWIETDVVPTRDGAFVCRHGNELSRSTDVAAHPRFAARKARKIVDGIATEGWFAEDFTLDELRMLGAREPLEFRDHQYDGSSQIVALGAVMELAARKRRELRRAVGVVVEIKHPTYFASIGFNIEDAVVKALEQSNSRNGEVPVIVESFEPTILRNLHRRTGARIVQLLDAADTRPADYVARGNPQTYGQMCTPAGLAEVAEYAFAIGPWKRLIVPVQATGDEMGDRGNEVRLREPTSLISDAHAAGLQVHAWTFRDEPRFLAADYAADPLREYQHYLQLGLDGFITDFPSTAARALGKAPTDET